VGTTRDGTVESIVDTRRYPVGDPTDPGWSAVVRRARAELEAAGCTVLRDVVRPDLRAALRAQGQAAAPRAYTDVAEVNVYNTDPDPALDVAHPARRVLQRRNAFVARDRIPDDDLIARLYRDPGLQAMVAACFGLPTVHELADPFAALTLNVVAPGDDHPWHFDTNEIAVSMLTQAPDAGGVFEYAPDLRAEGDENHAGVRAVLDGDRSRVRGLALRPGDLQLFRGRFSLHRVTPVEGHAARHSAIFAYSTRPGVVNSATRSRQLFGRVDAAHRAATVRSDALQD
jgi:hypothetical protein